MKPPVVDVVGVLGFSTDQRSHPASGTRTVSQRRHGAQVIKTYTRHPAIPAIATPELQIANVIARKIGRSRLGLFSVNNQDASAIVMNAR